ncbi:hypothetical protein QLQ12_14025 [Actinoplanes sp. NEAU-A12]|uniref:Integral membrane protein n=1 Tax=Actinoplanes sandaracinus TaxID=3045177 RepID=A0ABT6WJ10_9ACTN|nr:hypothetical protein [Actinoplanes sandaracinus]MDI6099717.1 hypothetical protein [Actinoplanes sandaracinus]
MSAEKWPSIPAVLRVMAGWFMLGIGLLNLAVEIDGGLTGAYLMFHVVLGLGGVLMLLRRRPVPSRAGCAIAGVLALAGMVSTALPGTSRCCLEDPPGHGYPYPFLGTGGGVHVEPAYLVVDLIFWGCAGLLAMVVLAVAERALPQRRTPIDLRRYRGHAEPAAMSATPDRAGENVGGLT